MYLRVGGRMRPFNEARANVSYVPRYDIKRRMVSVTERWDISGRVILQSNATQTRMTAALRQLELDYTQPTPDLVFMEDDGVRESFFRLLASECMDGPTIETISFPATEADIYATGTSYGVTFVANRSLASSGASVLLEFKETLSNPQGGRVDGFVGGAINFAERQTFKQNEPYLYTQSGSAVGLYGYPQPPPPLWPNNQLRAMKPTYESPRIIGRVNTEYAVSWEYEFGSIFPLVGSPHEVI